MKYILGVLLIYSVAYGQSCRVEGSVFDELGDTVELGTVIVMTADAQTVEASYWDRGHLQVEIPNPGEYMLKVSAFNREDTTLTVVCNQGKTIRLGDLRLKNINLQEVSIDLKSASIKTEGSSVAIDLEGANLDKLASTEDLLNRLPNVIMVDDQLSVVGRGTPLILLDNQPITLDQLKMIPPENIAEIKIDLNPSVQYSAEAEAVILVKSKRSAGDAVRGYIDQSAKWTNQLGGTSRVGLAVHHNKLAVNTTLSANQQGNWIDWYNVVGDANNPLYELSNNNDMDYTGKTLNLEQKLAYEPNERNRLVFSYGFMGSDHDAIQSSRSILRDNGGIVSEQSTEGLGNTDFQTHQLNGQYTHTMDSLGSNLFIGAMSIWKNLEDKSETFPKFGAPLEYGQHTKTENRQNSFQADLHKVLDERKNFRFGIQGSRFETKSIYDQFSAQGKINEEDLHELDYVEMIGGVYGQYEWKIKESTWNLGARLEQTSFQSKSTDLHGNILLEKDTTYLNVFPMATISFSKGKVDYSMGVSGNISRPFFGQLNPGKLYMDSLNYAENNPNLLPETMYSFQSSATFQKKYVVDIRLANVWEPMGEILEKREGDPEVSIYRLVNLESRQDISVGLSAPWNKNKLTTFHSLRSSINFLHGSNMERQVSHVPQLYYFTSISYQLRKKVQLSSTYFLMTRSVNGVKENGTLQNLTLGTNVSLGKWNLGINLNDILKTLEPYSMLYLNSVRYESYGYAGAQNVQVSIRYNFGKSKSQDIQQKEVGADQLNRN